MRKLLLPFTLLLLMSVRAAAQGDGAAPPSVRLEELKGEAARLLESQANRERAWGAYLAGRNGLDELEPALVRTLADPALADGPEEKIVRQAALDALIRLGARVPAETLRALPQEFSDEVIILLAEAPEDNRAALLEMFAAMAGDDGPDTHWLAAGNLLAGMKAHGFAALLLRDLKVEAVVGVMDWDGGFGGGSGGGGGCGCCAFYAPPEGLPPVSYYSLTTEAEHGAVVFAPGRRPVFFLRSTSPYGGGGFSPSPERDVVRVEYLAALLDTTEKELGFDARPLTSVVCKEARQCRRELAGVRGRIHASYAAMVGRLVKDGHLDGAGDAPAAPPMTFTLYDYRRSKTFPLPDKLDGVTILVENVESDGEAAGDTEAP